jgi:F-type H+-transporting ATPase subunit epsilon
MASLFDVFLVTPEREVWSGKASFVLARGSEGDVGIQAGHTPMLIHLAIGPLFIQTEEERRAVAVDGGFLHVITWEGETRVDVLAEHAELANEIDLRLAEERRAEAERRLAERAGDEEVEAEARAELAKAEVRIELQR